MKQVKNLPGYFLLSLLIVSLYFGYLIFRPFIAVIVMAAIFASIFYPIYKWILNKMPKRESLASFLTVVLFVLIILIPLVNFVGLLVRESIDTYPSFENVIREAQVNGTFDKGFLSLMAIKEQYLPFLDVEQVNVRQVVLDLGKSLTSFIVKNANVILAGTTNFFVSLFFFLITMFFFLRDGEKFMERLQYFTPLTNKYDRKLFQKFQEVSKSTIVGSLITAVVQGTLAGVAYAIVGVPVLFLGFATAIASLIPIVGTALVLVPVGIVLLLTQQWWQAIFLLVWGIAVIGLSDNFIRAKVIGKKSKIHPLLVFFSIFGGISVWGFLGIIFGPLVLAILLTIIHIYELEYAHMLER